MPKRRASFLMTILMFSGMSIFFDMKAAMNIASCEGHAAVPLIATSAFSNSSLNSGFLLIARQNLSASSCSAALGGRKPQPINDVNQIIMKIILPTVFIFFNRRGIRIVDIAEHLL